MSQSLPFIPGESMDPELAELIEAITDRLQAGEAVDLEAVARQHPDKVDELRLLLPALEMLAVVGSSSGEQISSATVAGEEEALLRRDLGDFRILREVGRGGMGVVYEAEQLSLGRRVALKVLPFAATMDARHLQRFHNEARAAAGLHHEHIVPVHAVGCERSVHFYAMQFIDGQTLAQRIAELRGEAADAQTAAKAASPDGSIPPTGEATEDYTPSPVAPAPETVQVGATATHLSTLDGGYFRRIAEWGIEAAAALEYAHSVGVVHRDIKPANLMVDAQAKLWVTDFGLARTAADSGLTMTGDLLGTLRYMSPEQALARHGLVDHHTDIYSLGVTLYEMLTLRPAVDGKDRQEILQRIAFEEPTPPRSRNRAIPSELETIILKTMAKEPAERYGTAKELAEDLRRFLDHRPIRAKRPSLAERARKWARRHRQLVGAGMLFLLFALLGLAIGTWLILEQRDTALEQRDRAEESLDIAYRVLDEIYLDVAEKRLPRASAVSEENKEILNNALRFYQQLATSQGTEPKNRERTAKAYQRVAGILSQLGQHAEAGPADRQALSLFQALSADFPDKAAYRLETAQAWHNLAANYLRHTAPPQETEHAYRRSLALMHQLVADYPDSVEFRYELSVSYNWFASWLRHIQRQNEEAEFIFQQSQAVLESIVAEVPEEPKYRQLLAANMGGLGGILMEAKKYQEAEKTFQRALRIRKKLFEENPRNTLDRMWMADGYTDMGNLLRETQRTEEALEAYRQSLVLAEALSFEYPSVEEYKHRCADVHTGRGLAHYQQGQLDEAITDYKEAIRLKKDYATAHNNLGVALTDKGQLAGVYKLFAPKGRTT